MKRMFVIAVAGLCLLSTAAFASPEPTDPKKQTPWKLYVDSREAYEMKTQQPGQVLFVDVRDPVEIMFTGFTDVVDVNIPFKLANRSRFNPAKPVLMMEINPAFEKQVAAELEKRSLGKDAPIILMCRSGGTRGAPSAMQLWGKGYSHVYVVTDGFEGGKLKEGDRKNWRLKNGWKNAGLPWSYKLNQEKIYLSKDD